MMTLEWLRRTSPVFASNIETYLNSSGPDHRGREGSDRMAAVAVERCATSPSLGIGSLKGTRVMDLLKRELAPITSEAWEQIDEEAQRVLKLHLAGRKLVDFSGPHGWKFGGVNTGRLDAHREGTGRARRRTRSATCGRSSSCARPSSLPIMELDYAARGAERSRSRSGDRWRPSASRAPKTTRSSTASRRPRSSA